MTTLNDLNVIDLPGETWRPIPGFQNYFASSAGRIATPKRKGTAGGLLKLNKSQPQRLRVTVTPKPGWPQIRERVAKLIALTFHGPRPSDDHCAAHRDGDITNNAPSNVFWKAA